MKQIIELESQPRPCLGRRTIPVALASILLLDLLLVSASVSAQPIRSPLFVHEYGPSPLSVASVTVAHGNTTIKDRPVVLREGEEYRIAMRLMVEDAINNKETEIRLSFVGSGPTVPSTHTIDTSQWQLGEVHEVQLLIRYPRLRYSGKATLLVDCIDDDGSPARLWAEPVFVKTVTAKPRVEGSALRAATHGSSSTLDQAFRLGIGASITLPLPESSRKGIDLLAVASFTNYDNQSRNGEAVAEVVFQDGKGRITARRVLRSGLHTAKYDYDEYPPGMLNSRQIHVLDSFDSGRTSRYSGKPYKIHIYVALIPLRNPIDATQITVRYLRDYGIFQVENIAIRARAPR